MSEPALNALLVKTLEQAQAREGELIALTDDQPSAISDRWTAKDHVAHLAAWREHAEHVVRAATAGAAYPEVPDIDAANAETYAANRDRPAHDVKVAAANSYAELISALRSAADADLKRPREGRPGEVWRSIPADGHQHVGQHLIQWHLEAGDTDSAEQIALWVRELDDHFSDPQSRAAAAYNLGCFYARIGRDEHAISQLAASLQLDPSLREWAREDADLVTIRPLPEVQRLLS
jgi:tetratricopeptide (TPR) repeat protein